VAGAHASKHRRASHPSAPCAQCGDCDEPHSAPRVGSLRLVPITLRPEQSGDLIELTGGDSPFDDFGPQAERTTVRPSGLDDAGGLTVVDHEGALVGDVSWHYVHWGPTKASWCPMIGIWLRPTARGRGIGRSAQRQLAALFFAHTVVNRVEAHTDVDNFAEQRALEAAGFRREGLIRGGQWRDGAYRDGYLYAVLRDDIAVGKATNQL
jgi:RimJ/RimL family protein N-acetyltransferase